MDLERPSKVQTSETRKTLCASKGATELLGFMSDSRALQLGVARRCVAMMTSFIVERRGS